MIAGPPFIVDRYGSFAACVIAERDYFRAALERIAKLPASQMKDVIACCDAAQDIARAALADNEGERRE